MPKPSRRSCPSAASRKQRWLAIGSWPRGARWDGVSVDVAPETPSVQPPLPKGVSRHEKVQATARPHLVKRLEENETKKGGIIIPDTAKEKPQEGEVIAVGPGK